MEIYVSPPLELPPAPDPGASARRLRYDRADLIFYGVAHSGTSYTARVFLDNPDATVRTEPSVESNYAGCFTVFGHAGCVGTDDDHCNPLARTVDEFDFRMPHPLLRQTKVVTVTDALGRLNPAQSVTVTVVAVVPGETEAESTDALDFNQLRLATYRHDGEEGEGEEPDLAQ